MQVEIRTKRELMLLKKALGTRDDWHEPDEQELTVKMVRGSFDNAMIDDTECHVVLLKDRKVIAKINLCMLLAWATGYEP